MRKLISLLIILLYCFKLNSQEVNIPRNVFSKRYGTYIQCKKEDGTLGDWVKVDMIWNPSKKMISKIQHQLKYLGYDIQETGVMDEQTGKQIALFNKDNKVKCFFGLRKITLKLLRKQYKEKKRKQ